MLMSIEEQSRTQIAAFLPDAIRAALKSYQCYSEASLHQEEKSFKEHHTACKVAISHIDLLLKLARWADLPDTRADDQNQQKVLMAAIKEAEKELKSYGVQGENDEGEDAADDQDT